MAFNKFLVPTLSSLMLMAAAPLAMAADYSDAAPAAAYDSNDLGYTSNVSNWNGFYAGVLGGYDWSGYKPAGAGFDFNGLAGGVFGGLNIEENGLLYGIDARLSFSGLEDTSLPTTASIPWSGDIRGRVGAVFDQTMVYGALGLAFADMKVTNTTGTDEKIHLGWTVGAGAEQNLGGNLFARADYSYTGYSNASYNTGAGAFDAKPAAHQQVKLGIGIRF